MNKPKNILLISPFFFPEPISTGKFNTEFALELSKKGHNVKVLCFHPFYPDWKIKKSKESLENITIIRGGSFLKFTKFSFVRRIILEISFTFFILRKIKKHQKNVDVIIPVFPPSLSFYSILSFLKSNIKKVGIVHDLQEIYSLNERGIKNKIITFFIHKIESKCYENCNKLIFLSKEMKEKARDLYNLNNKNLEVQYPFISIKENKSNDLENIFDSKKRHVVYSGALGEKQNPSKLYEFFNEASLKITDTVFHFFSNGEEVNRLKSNNKNTNIRFHDLVDKRNLTELYQKSTVQVIPQKEGTSAGSLPSKLPNLLASNCKILLITDKDSELNVFFNRNNLSRVETSWDNEILINSLNSILNKNIDFNHQIKIAKKYFTVDELIQKVLY